MTDEPKPNVDLGKQLLDKAWKADSVEQFRELISELKAQEFSSSASEIAYTVFQALKRFTVDDPEEAKLFITNDLWDWCLKPNTQDRVNPTFSYSGMQNLLEDWLCQYSDEHYVPIRTELLEKAELLWEPNLTRELIWMVVTLGVRTDNVTGNLVQIADDSSHPLNDTAIGALAEFGVPPEIRDWLLDIVADKLKSKDFSRGCILAVQNLVGPERVELATDAIECALASRSNENQMDVSIAFSIASKVADRSPDNLKLHQKIWGIFREHYKTIRTTPGFADSCDTKLVIEDHIGWFLNDEMQYGESSGAYIKLSRMGSLTRERQLESWGSENSAEFVNGLRHYATLDTKIEGRFMTISQRVKRVAWEIALTAGCNAEEWIEKAVLDETNANAANDICKIIACIKPAHLPPNLLELVATPEPFGDDDSGWVRHLGMIAIARSCSDRDSFDALLNFGLTRSGGVLLSTLRAIVDCALNRIREGDKDVVEKVLSKTSVESRKHHREAAISAFCSLAIEGEVPDELLANLWEFAVDVELDEFSRCSSLEAIGLANYKLTPEQLGVLSNLAQFNDTDVGWRAFEVLVRRDEGHEDDWQANKLGIEKRSNGLIVKDPANVTWWQAFLISLQFRERPQELAHCFATIVAKAPNDAMYQTLDSLMEFGGRFDVVARALVRRIRDSNGYGRTDTELFHVLQMVSEKKLLTLAKAYEVKAWLPIARTALCESIGRIAIDGRSNSEEALAWLRSFTGDASFQVRRSAYRALSKADPDRLGIFCSALCRSSNIETRKRGAECAAWLPRDRYPDQAVEQLGLGWDRESKVRDVWKGIIHQRRNRQLSQDYLNKLLTGCVEDNGVLNTYRYARALELLGDDETIDSIKNFLEKGTFRPNVRHFLKRLHKTIKKNWKKVTDKWPAPWTHELGFVEEVEAKLIIPGIPSLDVNLKLSCRYRRNPSSRSDWTAVAIVREAEVSLGSNLPSEAIEIQIPERESAKAYIFGLDRTINGTHAIFTLGAASHYPEGKRFEEPKFNDLQVVINQIFHDSKLEVSQDVGSLVHKAIEIAKTRAFECLLVDDQELRMKEVCQYTASLLAAIAPLLPETFNAKVVLWRIADLSVEPYSRTLRLTAVEIDDLRNLALVDGKDSPDDLVFWLLERLELQTETQPRKVPK